MVLDTITSGPTSIDAAYSDLDFEFGTPKIQTGSVIAGASAPGLGKNKWSSGAQ